MVLDLVPRRLVGSAARLEPLAEVHREGLRAAAGRDAEIWDLYPYSMAGEHFDAYWSRVVDDPARLPLAVMVGEAVVGVSGFMALDRINATLEIGGTYLAPEQRGGRINPQIKRLMLAEAFGCGARRVTFRIDALNDRSLAAAAKLGAVRDGVLRQDVVTWTGRVRDTVVLSILATEWPEVRDRLDARLA